MNTTIIDGRVLTVPKMTLIQLEDQSICACKITVAVCDGVFQCSNELPYNEENVDFFECIAFEEAARMINSNFVKGAKIVLRGKMKDHRFEDANKTRHFTKVLLVEQAEFGDTEAMMCKYGGKKKSMELSIVSDLKELYELYEKVCKSGYLCIDEDDYYNIAMSNMNI